MREPSRRRLPDQAQRLHAKAYNGKDASQTIPASSNEFHEGNPGEAHLLRCEGKGKGYCKVQLKGTGDSGVRENQ